MESHLPVIWASILAFAILVYVLLDGFDLGVGILFGTTRDEDFRRDMMSAIAPVWDGNETWLVIVGTVLFGAFPVVYAIFLSAFYLPVTLLLVGLILRGCAFEFRYKTQRRRWVWDLGFFGGSVVATFVQGVAIGAMAAGLPIENGRFVGGPLDWLSPFAALCGIGLVVGYSLLGAGWIVLKTEDRLRDWAYRRIMPLLLGVLGFLALVFAFTLVSDHQVIDRWLESPWLFVFPAIGAGACYVLWRAVRARCDWKPFAMTAVIFLAAFATMGGSFWPYMVPFTVTVEAAASPTESLEFMLYAGFIALPITLIYTVTVYWIFRGKVHAGSSY